MSSEAHAPALTEALHTLRSVTYVSSETARTAAALERIADLLEADKAETATRRRTHSAILRASGPG